MVLLGYMLVNVPLMLWPLSRGVSPLKEAMYPFGCEVETSLQGLFEYFKRCLQHGEWELASACVPQLVNSTLSENLQGIIKAIVCHPYNLKWVMLLESYLFVLIYDVHLLTVFIP